MTTSLSGISWQETDTTDGGTRRLHGRPKRISIAFLLFGLFVLAALWPFKTENAPAQTPPPPSSITVRAFDLQSGNPLAEYTFIVNVDNAHYASDPLMQRPSIAPTESNSPVVARGDQDSATVNDLPAGRYLISIRSPGHKLWGKHITLPADAGNVDIKLREGPFPLGKIRVFVFNDNTWVNSAPDTEEGGLRGFHVTIEEQTDSQVTVDYFNNPLCGGDCVTANDGFVQLNNLGPATYFVYVTPPAGPCNSDPDSEWIQTTTIDGGFNVQMGVEEGSDGSGAPGESLWEPPNRRTGNWFGFICSPTAFPDPGSGEITGRALNWVGWPPFDNLLTDPNEPVANAYIGLSDSSTDRTVYVGQADGDGNFDIQGVPEGTYNMSIWNEELTYIIRFLPVTVGSGETVDLGEVGVSRWYGWLSGDVYFDNNRNGIRDPGEPGVAATDVDQRWRDGSIKEETLTDVNGHYEYPTAEGGPLGKWIIGEQGFGRLGVTGAAVHDEYDPSIVTHVPSDLGGNLLTNQLLTEGHRAQVDWGKYAYGNNETGQIVGITYYATTRNEFDARFQAHENYEAAIPDVKLNLEDQNGNVLNVYVTDHWSPASNCDVRDANGADISGDMNPLIGPNCLEVPMTGVETKDGAFDGGYAFADYCPNGFDESAPDPENAPCWNAAHNDHQALDALVPGTYVVHVLMPEDANGNPLYQIVREEDVNVDLGADFVPAIPPPPCVGDSHEVVIDHEAMPRGSPYEGQMMPLCDKRLVQLQAKQNANADFFMMTNFKNGSAVEIPGRIIGLVSDDIYFDRDPQSIWYGEARPIGNIPIGIRDYLWRPILTVNSDENGTFEALLPSTETFNCPIPQGPCPGMYVVVVNDPGDKANPNPNYNPDYLTASFAWDVWPGLTTQLDVPLDPISGTGCDLPIVNDIHTPELLQVRKVTNGAGTALRPDSEQGPFVRASDTGNNRRMALLGDHFRATTGTVTLTDRRTGDVETLTSGNGGIVSWADRQIVIRVPTVSGTSTGFHPGPKQLAIRTAGGSGRLTTNGITVHVLGSISSPSVAYNPTVRIVAPPTTPHAIQNAIDAAGVGDLVVLRPGVYHENVLMWKPLKLQGLGPGGIVGAPETEIQTQPEDARFNIQGSGIDGRFFHDDEAAYDAKIASLGALAGVDGAHPVLRGADITVLAKTQTAYNIGTSSTAFFDRARIDGIGLTTGRGEGAGGIQLQAYARNFLITNDVLQSNGGVFAGGIGVGQPYFNSHNDDLDLEYDRLIGNGGLVRSGGMGIFRGSNGYDIGNSIFCSNFGVEYGAGISHWGLSPGGRIHDNQIYYNEAVDSGAGIMISQEQPQPVNGQPVLGDSSGAVDVDRNLIQSNYSWDDGGGIFVMNAMTDRINIRNNMIVDNGAADIGGAVMLDDSSNVSIVNNTIANNVSTASSENSALDEPHSAGLASEANDPLFQATLPASAKKFSNPVALFNNIFWNNQAFTLSQFGPGATLVSQGFIDFEVAGTCAVNPGCSTDTFTPRYSLLTNGNILGADGVMRALPGGQGNIVGQDPLFIEPFILELTVAGSRLDPQAAAVTITGADPPVSVIGDYHIATTSPAIDRGVRCALTPSPAPANALASCTTTGRGVQAPSGTAAAPQGPTADGPYRGGDFDGQYRPQRRVSALSLRARTPWDLGADELSGTQVTLP